jgi:hypothetical protein
MTIQVRPLSAERSRDLAELLRGAAQAQRPEVPGPVAARTIGLYAPNAQFGRTATAKSAGRMWIRARGLSDYLALADSVLDESRKTRGLDRQSLLAAQAQVVATQAAAAAIERLAAAVENLRT